MHAGITRRAAQPAGPLAGGRSWHPDPADGSGRATGRRCPAAGEPVPLGIHHPGPARARRFFKWSHQGCRISSRRCSSRRHPTNLATPPTTLIGRAEEVVTILSMLGEEAAGDADRPQTGKTRLALEIGAEALDRYPDGIFFVDLTPDDPALVMLTIAATLGVREVGQPCSRRFGSRQADAAALDNCERILAARRCGRAAGRGSDRLHSRHQPGGAAYPVARRSCCCHCRCRQRIVFPNSRLAQVPAIGALRRPRLGESPGLQVDRENAAVAAICRRLDGLPWPSSWPRHGSKPCPGRLSWLVLSNGCPC